MFLKDSKAAWYLAYYGTEEFKLIILHHEKNEEQGKSEIEILAAELRKLISFYKTEGTISNNRLTKARKALRDLENAVPETKLDEMRIEVTKMRSKQIVDDYNKLIRFRDKLRKDGFWDD